MLTIGRKFGESVLIGSVRITCISWRQRVAELLVVRGAAISFLHLEEDKWHHMQIDGTDVCICWRRKWSNGSSRFSVVIDAPRHIQIQRSELLQPAVSA